MTHNILVPTDFSNDAYNALFYATQLYKHEKCTFHILHIYNYQSHFIKEFKGPKTRKNLLQYLDDRSNECLRETYHRINGDTEQNPLHTFLTIPKNDIFIDGVKNFMDKNPIDLIVMGTKGRTGAKDIFFGGNTIQMVKSKIDCPLLCIPKQMDYQPISQMAYITSYKHTLGKDTLTMVKSIKLAHEAALHVVHISNDDTIDSSQEENKVYLTQYFEDTQLSFHSIPFEKSKAKTIAKFTKTHKIDLISMCYYPHYFLDKLFREPVVLDLSIYTEKPLFIIPTQE